MNQENRKVVLITGGGGALGSELALRCAAAGWEIILIDRKLGLLEPVHERIVSATGRAPIIQPLNLAAVGPGECEELVAAVRAATGRLDALIHCAASFQGLQPIEHVDPQSWLQDFQVNVHAAWLLSVSCLPLLKNSPEARLFFLSENLDRVSSAYWGAYGASKWALEGMARQFSVELSRSGVRVLSIDPGPMRSALRANAYHAEDPTAVQAPIVAADRILELLENHAISDHCHVVMNECAG